MALDAPLVLARRTPCCNVGVKHRKEGSHRVRCPRCDREWVMELRPADERTSQKMGRPVLKAVWRSS